MSRLQNHIKTFTTNPGLYRHLSSITAKTAKKKNSCEETDCCGNPINPQPKPKMCMERSCDPCSFYSWKPKIPILESAPPLADIKKKPFKKMQCYAGMKFREKNLKEAKEAAARCWKKCAAVPDCTPPPPPPPKKEEPDCDVLIIPLPDWDVNREEQKDPKCPC